MTDKYPKLRQDLAAAIADAKRQGGVNERAEQIAALLAERDTLAAAPVSAEPVGYVSRDASIARMTTNLPEGSPLYAAPVPSQPDLTQQTLDDVIAGIPARDAEIEALRKEIETLQSQHANIEAFVACDASAISYLSLGEYRTALLKMLRQKPATKEPGA